MPRFTVPPNFAGTAGDDIVIGEDLNKFPAIGIDILTGGTIDTLEGDDSITGTGNGINGYDSDYRAIGNAGNGTGISNTGSLFAGSGNNTFTGTGTGGNAANGDYAFRSGMSIRLIYSQ